MLIHTQKLAYNNEEFEKQVRLLIGKPDGPIYKTNLAGITSLHLSGENITDINGIENFVDLFEIEGHDYLFFGESFSIETFKPENLHEQIKQHQALQCLHV